MREWPKATSIKGPEMITSPFVEELKRESQQSDINPEIAAYITNLDSDQQKKLDARLNRMGEGVRSILLLGKEQKPTLEEALNDLFEKNDPKKLENLLKD